jgi:anti-sigma regulatory factor (Ser/Thr protein kinase)
VEDNPTTRHVLGYVEHGERRRLDDLRLAGAQPGRFARLSLPPSVDAPAHARRIVAGFVGAGAPEALRFALQLIASELIENAVLYGSREEAVRLELAKHRDWIELTVTNGGDRMTMADLRSGREGGGRGLEIVDALAWGWTIDTGPLGTAISVRLPIVESPFDVDREVLGRLAHRATGYEMGVPSWSKRRGPSSSFDAVADPRG